MANRPAPRPGHLAGLATVALLALDLPPGPASADSYFCTNHPAPSGSTTWFCAGTETTGAIGWNSQVSQGDTAGPTAPASASCTGSNGGDFAASASAQADANPGLLSVRADASSFGSGPGRSSGGAQASFLEVVTLAPLAGAAPGSPVAARLTLDVGGGFATSAAGADGQVTVYRGAQQLFFRNLFLSNFDPDWFEQVDLPGLYVGDVLTVFMSMRAFAPALDTGPTGSSANVTNGAKLRLDVTSPNAVFVSPSGHDYRTLPEPGWGALAGVGVAALAAVSRSRASRSIVPLKRLRSVGRVGPLDDDLPS